MNRPLPSCLAQRWLPASAPLNNGLEYDTMVAAAVRVASDTGVLVAGAEGGVRADAPHDAEWLQLFSWMEHALPAAGLLCMLIVFLVIAQACRRPPPPLRRAGVSGPSAFTI
jgi:hypothetical protein